MITLEKIDQIVERTGVSYAQAKEALEKAEGDVVEAIIYIEQSSARFSKSVSDGFMLKKDEVIETLKDLIQKGNVTKIIIEKDAKKVLEVPVNIALSAGVLSLFLGTLLIPVVAVIGTGMYIGNFRIKVINDDGSEIDVNEETQRRLLELKNKVDISKKNEEKDDLIDITNEVINEADKETEDNKEDEEIKDEEK
ncbi:hypothetical protein HMPREF9630_00980 [Peptoanaerobacter stomatis]|uniref:DUF4342 domain-containing protein n=1 Tax=Peptoanaerobacter stomatis TaxID=796937 RepID=V9HN48_9FIRM|nr:DUF4342 domain-containing protein [Peptoanaerobacter stomatis]EHL14679.1 hypothetical protein HMPREF9630_00980 [Peptoanaerobacter stomatis]